MEKENNAILGTSQEGEIVLYQPDENIQVEVKIDANLDTVWLTQQQIAELFGVKKAAISKHIKNIFASGELNILQVVSKMETTAADGKRYKVAYYCLDMILSIGYRVNSHNATRFRQWATSVLREHLLKGYSINHQLVALQQNVDNRIDTLENRMDKQEKQVEFLVNLHQQPSEQLFATGCTWDAWAFVSTLIRAAKQRIILIDNYADERTLLMLDKRHSDVSCTLHTRDNSKINLDLAKHNEQNAAIALVALPKKVHDRYLIVDDKVWLLGASVKDMGKGLCTVIEVGFTAEEIMEKIRN